MCLLMHGTFYPSETLHHAIDNSRSTTRKEMVLGNTRATLILARNCVLTNATVSQEDTKGWGEKYQDFAQLLFIVKLKRKLVMERKTEIKTISYSSLAFANSWRAGLM